MHKRGMAPLRAHIMHSTLTCTNDGSMGQDMTYTVCSVPSAIYFRNHGRLVGRLVLVHVGVGVGVCGAGRGAGEPRNFKKSKFFVFR